MTTIKLVHARFVPFFLSVIFLASCKTESVIIRSDRTLNAGNVCPLHKTKMTKVAVPIGGDIIGDHEHFYEAGKLFPNYSTGVTGIPNDDEKILVFQCSECKHAERKWRIKTWIHRNIFREHLYSHSDDPERITEYWDGKLYQTTTIIKGKQLINRERKGYGEFIVKNMAGDVVGYYKYDLRTGEPVEKWGEYDVYPPGDTRNP